MSYKNFLKDIKNGLKPVYLLLGDEYYLIENSIDYLIENKMSKEYTSFNLNEFNEDNVSIDGVIDAAEMVPFFDNRRIVVVKSDKIFKNKLSNHESKRLKKYLENPYETTCLIFVLSNKPDKRKSIYKNIKKYGEIISFDAFTFAQLSKWIIKKVNANHRQISKKTLNFFIERIGYFNKNSEIRLYDIEKMVIKIIEMTPKESFISEEMIANNIKKSLDKNIFDLTNALTVKDANTALKIFIDLVENDEPELRILFMINRQFKLIGKIKMLLNSGYSAASIGPKVKLPKYIVSKISSQLYSIDLQDILHKSNLCMETEYEIKTGQKKPQLAIEKLIVQCCM